jgi:hypothetical protein
MFSVYRNLNGPYLSEFYHTFLLLISGMFMNKEIRAFVVYITPDAISHLDCKPYWETDRYILDMTWSSTGKCIFTEGLYRMGSDLILICPLRLLSLLRSTSLFPGHTIDLWMQCVDWFIVVLSPDSYLFNDAMPTSCFWIATILWSKYALIALPFITTHV